jgi:hypothetical protein
MPSKNKLTSQSMKKGKIMNYRSIIKAALIAAALPRDVMTWSKAGIFQG